LDVPDNLKKGHWNSTRAGQTLAGTWICCETLLWYLCGIIRNSLYCSQQKRENQGFWGI